MTPESNPRLSIEHRYLLAKAWHGKGTAARAIQGYRDVLAHKPDHLNAALQLAGLLEENSRPAEALAVYEAALEHHPNEAHIHKRWVHLTVQASGLEEVFRRYRLERRDTRPIDLRASEPVCCVVLRNELERLPYFLEYYRGKGIRTFFAVDNGSTDGSVAYLLDQFDVRVWQSDLSFRRANFGAGWWEPLLRKYGQGQWALIVDADELLYYPDCERKTIPQLCRELDGAGKRAYNAILLDMYSDRPIRETNYNPGEPFESVCSYFDRRFYHTVYESGGPYLNQDVYFGGARQRVFGDAGEYCLSKVPLLKYELDCTPAGGQHWTNLPPSQIAHGRGCLLHFKYFASFHNYVSEETERGEHYGGAMQYREYQRGLKQDEPLQLYNPAESLKLVGAAQLVELGIMQRGIEDHTPEIVFPRIDPVPAETPRPFWSVMITAYRRTEYLRQALESVLAQAPSPEQMQIEVVSDGPDDPVQAEIEAIVQSLAGSRVTFYRHPVNAGPQEIFNVCVRRAQGHWIHLLRDDDWVAAGFYERMHAGIGQASGIGAAFCRHTHMDAEGTELRRSFLERESSGVIENWLERIGCFRRLEKPSVVVARDAYQAVGGYCAQAKSAFDWEMWLRLAARYPFWYEPKPLAFFRDAGDSEGTRLMASGDIIADARRVIDIARTYLPDEVADSLAGRAAEHYGLAALEISRRQMAAGDYPAAVANLREALLCSQSVEVMRGLASVVTSSTSGLER